MVAEIDTPQFDIVATIVNYHMKDDVLACVRSLLRDVEGDELRLKIVVVDNNSQDGLSEALYSAFPDVRFIPLADNVGMGAGNNIALREYSASYYFVLNPDILFPEGQHVVRGLFTMMEAHPRAGICGPQLRYPDGSLQYSCWRFPTLFQPLYSRTSLGNTGRGKARLHRYIMKDVDHTKQRPVDALMGSALFVRGKAISEVGMFDDGFFMYFEDIDWCVRMWEHGWAVYYVPSVYVVHAHGRGSAKVSGIFRPLFTNALARIHIRSWIRFMWKWRGVRIRYDRTT
jgi:GT2 family glycosyltransferase